MSSFLRRVYTKAGNDTTLCNGEPSVALTGSVTGGTTTGIWTVLNGSGTLNSPTTLITDYTPSASDYSQGTLTFVLSSTGNCEPVTDTVVVDFIESPTVSAGPDDTYCDNNVPPIPINGTLGFAAGATWSGGNGGAFGNSGNLSTTYTPSPTDIAADSVVLYLTSAGSFFACPDDEDTVVIYFTDPPLVQAGPDLTVCSSATDFPLAGSVSGVSTTGAWTTSGSGAFTPSQTDLNADYLISGADTAVGTITMVLTSTNNNNCVAVQDSFNVTFLDQPIVQILTDDSICSNLSTIPLDGTVSAGFSTNWTTNGAGLIVTPSVLNTFYNLSPIDTTNGFIDIILSTTGGICPVESDSVRIIFIDPPRVDAGTDQAYCSNEPIQLVGTIAGTNAAGTWTSTGTGNFSPSPDLLQTIYFPSANDVANGTINLILTSTNNFGCIPDADTLVVTFKDPPVADFSFTDACVGSNTMFTDLSTSTDGFINSWMYDFGDQSSSIADDPQHNYPAAGAYNVTLIVGSSNGCFDTIMQPITVNPVPIPDFTNGLACVGEATQMTDQSFISSGSIVSWDWDFDNGLGISTDQNPTYTFSGSGSFPVILTVTSDLGCSAILTQNISVLAGPSAAFNMAPNPAIALEDVFFTDESTGAGIVGWFWDFGDESGGNNQNEIHDYADGGDYIVTLTVTDDNGCTSSISQTISVALLPVLPTAFTPNGSGDNDVFLIRGGPFTSVNFNIYNNWGQLIFNSTDANVGWDGTYEGVDSPIGVYTWTFQVGLAGGRVVTKSGDVTLMR